MGKFVSNIIEEVKGSIVGSIVGNLTGVAKAIQRYFTQLDPVANAHYELVTPVTLTGDFDIGIKLLTTDTTNQVILGDIHTTNLYMNMSNGSITLWLNGQYRAFNTTNPLDDGKLHDVLFQLRANTLECIIDGESLGTLNVTNPVITSANLRIGTSNSVLIYFDDILSDLKITDKSGAEDVTTTFALDKPPASALYEYGSELVVNGDFATDTDWSKTGNGAISNGTAIVDGTSTQSLIFQNAFAQGVTYEISLDVTSDDGQPNNELWNNNGEVILEVNGVGLQTVTYTHSIANGNVLLRANGGTWSANSISIREITNYAEVQGSKNIEYSKEAVLGGELAEDYLDVNNWTARDVSIEAIGDETKITSLEATNDRGEFTVSGLTIGNTYRAEIKARAGTGTDQRFRLWTFADIDDVVISEDKIYTIFFTATAASGLLRVYANVTGAIGDEVFVGDISIKELVQGNALTRINVADEDIELFKKSGNQWDNISPLPQELPAVIQIATQA